MRHAARAAGPRAVREVVALQHSGAAFPPSGIGRAQAHGPRGAIDQRAAGVAARRRKPPSGRSEWGRNTSILRNHWSTM